MTRTERRIQEYVAKNCPGKFARVDVRFRGGFCYIDACTDPEDLSETTHLCRLPYLGNEHNWAFAFYTYAHEKYERSFLLSGSPVGTPEEAFETSTLFY